MEPGLAVVKLNANEVDAPDMALNYRPQSDVRLVLAIKTLLLYCDASTNGERRSADRFNCKFCLI